MNEPKRVVPEHIARLMSPEDRKKYGIETMDEICAEKEYELERELHARFLNFLRRYDLGYYHADMSRRSTIARGMPDFGVYRNSRIVWIEFKIANNKLSPDQKDRVGTMLADGNEVHVCYDYQSAIRAVMNFFGLK